MVQKSTQTLQKPAQTETDRQTNKDNIVLIVNIRKLLQIDQ